ncbi:MAG: methyltransferase, partial [Lachnospiraceae bacterium]|nr:methyltransferase [Lachnospiraceae bacterium]
MVPKFDPKELTPAPGASFSRPVERFSFPLSQFEANEKAYKGEPWWQMQQAIDTHPFMPDIIPDNIARGFVFEANMAKYAPNEMKGGPDMFGIEWEY